MYSKLTTKKSVKTIIKIISLIYHFARTDS